MTENEVLTLLAIPNKIVVRQCSWTVESGGHTPPWKVFESAIEVNGVIQEGLRFRARYRPPKTIQKGKAEVELKESLSVALFSKVTLRIAAIDTTQNQLHINRVGKGRRYYEQTINTDTHRHIWVGEYGYVEPITPPIYGIEELFNTFAKQCNLNYTGRIPDPRIGEQGTLL